MWVHSTLFFWVPCHEKEEKEMELACSVVQQQWYSSLDPWSVSIHTHDEWSKKGRKLQSSTVPPCLFSVLLQLLRTTIKGSALKIVCVLKKERVLLSVSMLPFYHASFFKVQTTKTEQNQCRWPHENCFFLFFYTSVYASSKCQRFL